MKNTDNATTTPTTSNDETLISIETPALDGVTGGCAACGSNCAAGLAPAAKTDAAGFDPFKAFVGR